LFAGPTKQHWIIRYKLYHIPFWMLYHFIWWVVYDGNPKQVFFNIFFPPHNVKFLFYVLFQALGVYFCLYYLIPKFLEKGNYLKFLIYLLMTVVVASVFVSSGYFISAELAGKTVYELYNIPVGRAFTLLKSQAFPSTISAMTLAMSIKLSKNWIEGQKQQRILEKEKLETELKFLRSQFNPHFLFNSINSIFVLIDQNPAMATESLAKFSDLLRYQLYECNESQIPLDRELSYLGNFIELEKLRQDEQIEINVSMPNEQEDSLSIAPFILMPFIENAFKHVSQNKNQLNQINISIRLLGNQLIFNIENTITQNSNTDAVNYGGLGLRNVKRRLELIYPKDYKLDILTEENRFYVTLSIHLTSLKVQHTILEKKI